MGQRRAGQKVRRARTGARGAEHEPLTQPLFGIARSGEAHALFVLPAIERQLVAHVVQRLAQTGHVAMAKDAETATAQAHFLAVNLDELVGQASE